MKKPLSPDGSVESPTHPEADKPASFLQSWDWFWFNPVDPIVLGLMRVCVGLVVFYIHLGYSFDLMSYVGANYAWVDEQGMRYFRYQMPVHVPPWDWKNDLVVVGRGQYTWSLFLHLQDPAWIWTFHGCMLGVIVLFTLGLWTRVTSVLVWMGALNYIHRSPVTLFGMDTMMMIALFYLMIGPSGATLSLDRWLTIRRFRREHGPDAEIPSVPPSASANFVLRMTQIHFCFIYMAAGLSKLLGSTWWGGIALWRTFANYNFAPLDVPVYSMALKWLTQHRWLWEIVMTGSVVYTFFVEIGLPFLIWLKRWRWVMIILSTLLHLGIGLFMGLVTFSMMMLCLLASFLPPEAVRSWLEGVETMYLNSLKPSAPGTPRSEPIGAGSR